MGKSRPYRCLDVKNVSLDKVLANRAGQPAVLGVDVGKASLYQGLWWKLEDFEQPWVARNPTDVGLVVELAKRLAQGRQFCVALESSGTYGDALRQALSDAKIQVRRVSSKASHDYAEIFDGVPSQHDGKDALVIAELSGTGKSAAWAWQPGEPWEQQMQMHLDEMETLREMRQARCGQLEALLARYWPEALTIQRPSSMTLARALRHYGDPQALAQDPKAAERLLNWSGGRLKPQTITALVESAAKTVGVRTTDTTRRSLRHLARRLWRLKRRWRQHRRAVIALAQDRPKIMAMAELVGEPTACVLWTCLGDPANYASAAAYRKAMGLNLAERSSGKYQGQLKLSKRGRGMARRWMYLAALRHVRSSERARGWYRRKRLRMSEAWRPRPGYKPRPGVGAVVAVMRKLALALHAIGKGAGCAYDATKLFKCRQKAAPAVAAAPEPLPAS
jgi:transposase